MSHSRAYILGSGHFGSRAFFFLQPRFQPACLTVVDKRYNKLKKIITKGGNAVVMDAISFLQSSKEKPVIIQYALSVPSWRQVLAGFNFERFFKRRRNSKHILENTSSVHPANATV